jgi:hypothetical protein
MKGLPKEFNAVIVDADGVFACNIPPSVAPLFDSEQGIFTNVTEVEDLENYDQRLATKLYLNAELGTVTYIKR